MLANNEVKDPATEYADIQPVGKIETGIEGFENLSMGGIPEGRTTLVVGSAGSGKTIFSLELLWRGITQFNRNGVFITCEEHGADVLRNVKKMGWDLAEMIGEGRMMLIDASPEPGTHVEAGKYDLQGLMTQIIYAVDKIGAKLVVLDSLGALFSQFHDAFLIRQELFRISDELKQKGVTSIFTAERLEEYGPVSRHGVEEFVSDNVVVLRGVLEQERFRRTMQILKYRGAAHHKGEYPFTITTKGISIYPLSGMELHQTASSDRISLGNKDLDRMCGGGLFADSIILVSGATGTGKTLLSNTFTAAGCRNDERVIYFAFEESRAQLLRNATSWGMGFQEWEKEGLLKMICRYPESAGLEDHLLMIRDEVATFHPTRVVVDSISAMEQASNERVFREFVVGMTSFLKEQDVCGLFTSTTPKLSGGESITEAHISTITDAIMALRYVEIAGTLRRGVAIIKMRGSQHDKSIHEYTIDAHGMKIGKQFNNVQNILLGMPTATAPTEQEQMSEMFR
jgi:circadian clock protein KaiC